MPTQLLLQQYNRLKELLRDFFFNAIHYDQHLDL